MNGDAPACRDENAPLPCVGMFDSGVGGLSVARAFLKLRPGARVRYVADWEHCPYGALPGEIVLGRALAISRELAAAGCNPIVVACNTASAVALAGIRAALPDTGIVGMEPAIKPAAALSRNGRVGVLATAHTLSGGLFRGTMCKFARGVRVIEAEGAGLVELVENGELDTPRARSMVAKALAPLLEGGCDTIALACTHYPALLPAMRAVAPGVLFVDPAEAVAQRVAALYDRAAGRSEHK
ncbi:MAG: aspartate/glutamate racemase family protein [Kiritimatiellae bacterium]|nr:aspartate/glutamate racemase family protein [Kiritimatiellia bacterium]